jgi:signal transduction histidine kinase
MSAEDPGHESKRQQTDASLRAEREKVDEALTAKLMAVDDAADEVISRARTRADQVLAAARARSDRQLLRAPGAPPQALLERERQRAQEDKAVRAERAEADEEIRVERAEHVALLSGERLETDKDLLDERTHIDATLATRDEFLGTVSHDLRNMLNTMVGYASLIADEVLEEGRVERVRVHALRIHRSGARMGRLIGDLVDVASIEAGALAVTLAPGDPAQVVAEAVETFQAHAAAHGISLTAEIVPATLLVSFDAARILQVLINLISNAIKFTAPHGSVVVRVEPGSDQIRFSVRDTGMGIPDGMANVIFERFHQLNRSDRRGVGLGLYISRCIVEGHGGKIWADSDLGEGSTLTFFLPASAQP